MSKKRAIIAGGVLAVTGAAIGRMYYARRRGSTAGSVDEIRAGLDEAEGLEEAYAEGSAAGEPSPAIHKPNRTKIS